MGVWMDGRTDGWDRQTDILLTLAHIGAHKDSQDKQYM